MSQNAKPIGRRELLQTGSTGVAALALAAIPLAHGKADPAEDAELRQLWAKYLDQLGRLKEAQAVYSHAREPYEAEYDLLKVKPEFEHRFGEMHRMLWKKHELEPFQRATTREHRKLIKLTKAIRKAKAETLFGIGVKLSASEHFEEYDVVEAAEDARRALGKLTGFDFIAATGPLGEDLS